MGFLDGLRILDFSRLLPGPFGTQLLADMGADVLKVEALGGGDYARYFPPMARKYGFMLHGTNRGKRSLSMDLKHPRAFSVVERLLGTHDIVVESFRAGVMDRLGLGYEKLRAVRPDVIMVALSGYGATGTMHGRAGHDINFLARTGVSASIGHRTTGPVIPGIQIADMSSGIFIALSVASAAYHRARTGEGGYVDLSMADCTFAMAAVNAMEAMFAGKAPGFGSNVLSGSSLCYQYYQTADGGYMAVGALEPEFWRQVCEAVELPELLEEAFTPATEQNPHYRSLAGRFREKTRTEWAAIFERFNACVEPVLSLDEAAADPLFASRGIAREIDHPIDGRMRVIEPPVNPDAQRERLNAPDVGEHTRAVLGEVGMSDEEIDALIADRVVQDVEPASDRS